MEVAGIDIIGYWLGIFLTICVLSFLYKDNPFYKFAEHLFIGVTIGYVTIQQYYNVIEPKLVDTLGAGNGWYLIALALVLVLFIGGMTKQFSWLGRFPIAYVVALFAGLQIVGVTEANLVMQAKDAWQDLDVKQVNINDEKHDAKALTKKLSIPKSVADKIVAARKAQPLSSIEDIYELPGITAKEKASLNEGRGMRADLTDGWAAKARTDDGGAISGRHWFAIFNNLLLFFGLIACLIYFYFSVEHKGVIGGISRFGIWILMIGFGAAFGFTVQGRLALALGRVQYVKGDSIEPALANATNGPLVALISGLIVAAGIVIWQMAARKRDASENS